MTPPSKTKAYSRRYDKLRRHGYHMTIDGTITRRKMAALQAIGYSLTDIGKAIGRTQQSLSETFHHTEAPIHRATAKAVDEVYERWKDKPNEGPQAERTRARAKRLRYPAPAAWDRIEDLTEQPKGVLRK